MPCSFCQREKTILARGLCGACYQRWKKRGTADYATKRSRSRCNVPGCDKRAVSHGLCDTHRKRMERHGHLEETRPDSWGASERHPMYGTWTYLRRHHARHPVVAEWINDFLQFAMDVGDRPSPKHKLYVANTDQPIGPGNFVWKRSVTERVEGEDEKTYLARRQRVFRALTPEHTKGYDLKKLYGMEREAYAALVLEQDGKCAICRQAEDTQIRGQTIALAVDHDHVTGAIRGLLCVPCNRGLGMFGDDPNRLKAAIKYLRR